MAETLFNQFADESALQAQRDFFIEQILKPIKEGIKGLNVNIGTIDSSQSKKSVDDLTKIIGDLEKKVSEAQKEITSLNSKLDDYAKAATQAASAQKAATQATVGSSTAIKNETQALQQNATTKRNIAAAEQLAAKTAQQNAKAKKDSANAELASAKAALENLKAKNGVTAAEIKSAKAAIDTAKAKRDLANAELQQAQATLSAANAKKSLADESAKVTAAQAREEKIIDQAIDDYYNLSKAYTDAALKAKNLQIRLGEQHPIAQQATKDALDLANTLKRLDASVGQNQRSVGDYKSAVRGLGFSFTQVARELPSLTVSVQQFALAISNNLPFVADSLKQTSDEIAKLKAEGKAAPSLFSAITKSVLSWQVALAIAITVMVQFAGKLFGAKTAAEKFDKSLHELSLTTDRMTAKIAELSSELEFLRQLTDITIKINFGDSFEGDLISMQGHMVDILTEIDALEKAEPTGVTAYLKASKKAFEETSDEARDLIALFSDFRAIPSDLLNELPKQDQKLIAAAKKLEEDLAALRGNLADKQREKQLLAANIRLKKIEEEKGKEQDIFDKFFARDLEVQRDQLLKKAENENVFIKDRLDAREKAAEIDKQIILGNAAAEIRDVKRNAIEQKRDAAETAKEISFIQRTAAADIRAIVYKKGEDVTKIEQQWSDRIYEVYNRLVQITEAKFDQLAAAKNSIADDRTKEAEKQFEEELAITEQFYDEQARVIASNLKRGRITLDQYNLDKQKNDRNFKRLQIEDEIKHVKKLIAAEALRPEGNTTELKRRKFALEKQLRDQDIADYEAYAAAIAEISKKSAEDIRQAANKLEDELKDAAFNILAGSYDKQLNAIRDQIDAVNVLKAAEIERINSGTGAAEEKAARIKIIEARAQNDREALERRQRQLEKKRAIVERAASAFTITIAGIRDAARIQASAAAAYALNMATVPPPFNVIAANFARLNVLKELPFVIASTAAALASVVGTPIPSYAKGTESSPEGIAEVAERGPELAVDKQGKAKLYGKHTLTYLTKGTKIYPADATKDILNAAEQERSGLLKSFNQNITISAPQHNSEELKKQTKILERLEGKSRIVIMNNSPIETEAWYQQHFKF